MKTYQSKFSDPLHSTFKRVAKNSYGRLNLGDALELGALLVLAEAGEISSSQEALALGVSPKAVVVFKRILGGESWK